MRGRVWSSVLDSLIYGFCCGVLCALGDVPIPLVLVAGLLAFDLRLLVRDIEDIHEMLRSCDE